MPLGCRGIVIASLDLSGVSNLWKLVGHGRSGYHRDVIEGAGLALPSGSGYEGHSGQQGSAVGWCLCWLGPRLVMETWQQGGDLYGLKFWKS